MRLREDQDLSELKARLEADPAVASVQFNRRFPSAVSLTAATRSTRGWRVWRWPASTETSA